MQDSSRVQTELLQAMVTKIIPWMNARETVRLLLAEAPVEPQSGIKILGYRPPLPRIPRLDPPHVHEYMWQEQFMNAPRHVGLGFVLDGEADYAVGRNMDRSADASGEDHDPGIQLLTFPEKTIFVLPAGVPRPNGTQPHWLRPNIEAAYSRILWLLIMPSRLYCHICETRGTAHNSTGVITIEHRHLEPIALMLVDELRTRAARFEHVAHNLLMALLWQVERDLNAQPWFLGRHEAPPLTVPQASLVVQGACRFIQQNSMETLTLPIIAAQNYISPSQLNKRFRAEVGMSVIDYLLHCRIEAAKHLLAGSEFSNVSIQQVGKMVGIDEPSYFGRVFRQRTGLSPTAFREQSNLGISTRVENGHNT